MGRAKYGTNESIIGSKEGSGQLIYGNFRMVIISAALAMDVHAVKIFI